MSDAPGLLQHLRAPLLAIAAAALCLCITAGCGIRSIHKEDAAAAAGQMKVTAETLSAYYAALDRELAKTENFHQAQAALTAGVLPQHVSPQDAPNQDVPPQDLTEMRSQMQLRAQLANEIGNLSSIFVALAGATDAAATTDGSSPGKSSPGESNLATDSMKALTSDEPEIQAVADDLREIRRLLGLHAEQEAAKKVEPLCQNLYAFFYSERRVYNSIHQGYLAAAKSLAHRLAGTNQADTSAILASALAPLDLAPLDLAPALSADDAQAGPREDLLARIDANYKRRLDASKKATDALATALNEMDARIYQVKSGRRMSLRSPPQSLATVTSWIAEVRR